MRYAVFSVRLGIAHPRAPRETRFKKLLPNPQALATRPRSIGIAQTGDGFVITFIKSPMPVANAAMEDWAMRLRRSEAAPA